ncbi:unnamed protein product [Cuscuta campestris]|uniref:CCHC-type domain-containing protein n=1 Tax=Cuscuta campestris TaxID=132261 RepID=A0A484KSB2_9ASTE|nr:unnamed protein product [Cuscuta campestris]
MKTKGGNDIAITQEAVWKSEGQRIDDRSLMSLIRSVPPNVVSYSRLKHRLCEPPGRRRDDRMTGIGEGQSTSRPPLFDGTNYSYWKERMRIYIRSTNFQLWLVIKNGEQIPTKKVGETTVPKTEDEFDAEDIKKEMWDKLEVTYEGTDQVHEAKIDILTQEYEMFQMKEGEKIDDMLDCFSKIINDLHALKKSYSNKDLVRKILCSLTPEWRSKVDAIYESIGVSNVTIDGLRALKATKEPMEEASSDDDNEFGLVIKKLHKFMKKEFERKGRKHDGPPKCYGCGEIGHIKPRCPKAKHGKDKSGFKKQRAYISWGGDSGDESTDQEEDEDANLCLMAHEDQSNDVQEAPPTTSEEYLYYGDGSYLWFDSEEERTRFLTFFSKRVVAPPRIVPERLLELQGYDDLDAQLHQTGLWPFISQARKEINPALIRVFYSNLRREDDVLYSLVKSTPIELTIEQLGRIAGLPYQGDDISNYGGEDCVLNNEGLVLNELGITELIRHATGRPTIHSANPESRLILYIVSRILKPRKHGHTIMSGEDLKLLHAIMHSAPINWAKFVMIYMTDATSTAHDHLLPYPFLVMDILERFNTQTFKKRSDNAWANLASIADSLNRLHFKVDGMDGYLERLDEAVQRQGHAMNAYFQRVNYVPPPYHGTFLGEVYGDEDEEDGSYAPSSSPD